MLLEVGDGGGADISWEVLRVQCCGLVRAPLVIVNCPASDS